MIEIHQQLESGGAPKICQRDIGSDRPQSHVGIERKNLALGDKAVKGIAVEVIAVRGVSRSVRIRIMRSCDLNPPTRSGDAKKFRDKGHCVGHVLGDMPTDDFVELIVFKWIRQNPEIVDDIGVGPGVRINANRPRCFVPATTDVENSSANHRRGRALIWPWRIHLQKEEGPVRRKKW